ncbi:MAG: F0F1 ATP synthase subunit beta, partial [Planctomycetes bacterium]|nr:F0F1 ATP synthase subunit beta [Planctomycetota bacterium]
MSDSRPERTTGSVAGVRGSVVDATFPGGLPPLQSALVVRDAERDVIVEIAQHLDERTARCIALAPTDGLRRGLPVEDTGGPLTVPVGDAVLGRMLDVFGRAIDGKEPLDGVERWPIHRPPLSLNEQLTSDEVFETGIKAIDLL